MEQALVKIRPHISSSLAHQKTPANLLVAIEATFQEQKTDVTSTAYYAALLTTLDGIMQKGSTGVEEGDILPAVLYLLALVAPFVSSSVLRANLETVLTLTYPLFTTLIPHAPALRSQITLYQYLFKSLDRSQLNAQGIRQSYATILQFCVDSRPKVRRKATEIIKSILEIPPAPSLRHPYADRTADWVKAALEAVNENPFSRPKGNSTENIGAETGIHLLQFLHPILIHLHPSSLPTIVNLLLPLPRLGNPFLSQSSYNVLSDLFHLQAGDTTVDAGSHISSVLQVVLASPPMKSDHILAPAWVEVLGSALQNYHKIDPEGSTQHLAKVWKAVWPFLESGDSRIRNAAADALHKICGCITLPVLVKAIHEPQGNSTLSKLLIQLTKAFDSFTLALAVPQLLSTVTAMIHALRLRPAEDGPTGAELLLIPLVQKIGNLRTQKGFEHKEKADTVLSTAMHNLGPHVLLRALPLNIEESERQAGKEARAFLLPLLDQPHPSPLGHFVTYFVPLSEHLFDLQQKAETEGRVSEAKVWSVLVSQIWNGFSGYCHGTADLKTALSPTFSQLLSQLLYTQPDLRQPILRGLRLLIESNLAISKREEHTNAFITPEVADTNITFLRTHTQSWLAVLFNIYGTMNGDKRTVVGGVISAWLDIAGEQEISKAYKKIVDLLRTNLSQLPAAIAITRGNNENDVPSVTVTTLDLFLLLLPHLNQSDSQNLFLVCFTPTVLCMKENGVQKRGYRILAKLLEQSKITLDALMVLRELDELTDGLVAAAKKDRFAFLAALVPLISPNALYVIPSLIPEVVLGTKEPSEKTRYAAFELIVQMGRKMNEGGTINQALMDGMDEGGPENLQNTTASIEEFMTMVSGGLAGASPHMISATVTAISRLIFEFKGIISPRMHTEIFSTLLVFLDSTNREIVKSTLGFVKLAVHTLPIETTQPYLKDIVATLSQRLHDHKNHFKEKVRHIFERLIRKFGWDAVYTCAEKDDVSKVLLNIKKRKDRAKRKKVNVDEVEEFTRPKPSVGIAFEDVLYGSEDEEDKDGSDVEKETRKGSRKNSTGELHLRVDNEEPLDLLKGVSSRVTSGRSRQKRPGKDASYFKTDEDGRMIIDEKEEDLPERDVAGDAYRESITSVDGFTRGPNGRVKFNKDTKKRRREEDNNDEMEGVDALPTKPSHKLRKIENKLGHEFKAKKAKGDIKKGSLDPYAYLPLSKAAKKGQKHLDITGKK